MSVKEDKREKAKLLIKQALDGSVGADEQSAFAVRAIKIIRKYKLLDTTPLDGILEHETVRAVKTVADRVTDPDFLNGLKMIGREFQKATAARRRRS